MGRHNQRGKAEVKIGNSMKFILFVSRSCLEMAEIYEGLLITFDFS